MAAARHTDSKPRPPMTTSTSHIMDLLQFFFFFKDSRLSAEGDNEYGECGENLSCDFSSVNCRKTK